MGLVNISKLKAASRMRKMAGQMLPCQGTGAGYMHKLMGRASGGRCEEESLAPVEGKSAGGRLDRPARKWGGRAHMKPKENDHDEDDKYAKGGMVKGRQTTDDGKGGWVEKDGSERPDGGSFAKGGFIEMKHPDSLRKALGAKEGENIPAKKLEKAEHSDNPKLRKRAILAETMKHWKKG